MPKNIDVSTCEGPRPDGENALCVELLEQHGPLTCNFRSGDMIRYDTLRLANMEMEWPLGKRFFSTPHRTDRSHSVAPLGRSTG